MKKTVKIMAVLVMLALAATAAYAQTGKIGYVDLRRAFYEYEKTKTMETELNELTQGRQDKRTKMIEEITKMRDEAQMLEGNAKAKKQQEIETKLGELQEYDRDTRQTLLNKKNEMFRQVIDDIQAIVEGMGEKGKYEYILDSRNIMYANPDSDLTDKVIEQLNK